MESHPMNIFFLHLRPRRNARFYVDRHVVKIIVEITQLLWSAWRGVDVVDCPVKRYRVTHVNHPLAIWVRKCEANYLYAAVVGLALTKEYSFRYAKRHACRDILKWLVRHLPPFVCANEPYRDTTVLALTDNPPHCTPVPLCMPVEFHASSLIEAYRRYYMGAKDHLATWRGRNQPSWWLLDLDKKELPEKEKQQEHEQPHQQPLKKQKLVQ